jgi:hypothetical protein
MAELIFPLFTFRGINMLTPVRGLGLSEIPLIPTSDVILEHARKIGTNAILTVPSFIEAWAESPDVVEYLKSMVFVVSSLVFTPHFSEHSWCGIVIAPAEIYSYYLQGYGGGPLPYEKGQTLVKAGVKLRCTYGGTEVVLHA